MTIKRISVAVIMAAFCACTAELDSTKEYVQLAATISDEIDSKTTASDEGDKYSVTWTGTDIVSVNGQQSQAIEVDVDNPKRAVFTFGVVTPPYSSVYPASACKSVSGTTGTVYLPSEQKYVS